ncbi:MAG: FdhF/YdeP family oxidoreductase [Armatimonadetes bacterium]|nr:FdhF/YdeP family oxidoreductase [Armatimonadota bacterium]
MPERKPGASRRVSLRPLGVGHQKPNAYRTMLQVAWENRDELTYAWRILNQGCCDGCALGTNGLRDWTMRGVHLCSVRLKMLRLNTMPAIDPQLLARPDALRDRPSKALRKLGRLPFPMIWSKGDPGYRRVSWDEALDAAAGAIRRTVTRDPSRLAFYMTSRGMPNEAYFTFQKTARFLGTNNIDNSARICHAPSTTALTKAIGYGATTCSYTDWIGTDLLVLVGSNLPNNQPVAVKYIDEAKKRGTRVVVVNPYREDGLVNYWVPSSWASAAFGTKVLDTFYAVRVGGDAAFFTGALKRLVETGRVDRAFVAAHSEGFDALAAWLSTLSWDALVTTSGASIESMRAFADEYARARTSVTVWSMGVTQHEHGEQNILAIANLALAMGRIGKPHTGLMPIRGHSGVQGGAEVGAVPHACGLGRPIADPAQREALASLWGFPVPERPGLTATAMIVAAHDGALDVLYAAGGNFLETLPDPRYAEDALSRVPVRVFQDIVINPMMLLPPGEVSIILPGATRYETPGGVTETTTERRIIYSPEVPGRRVGEARPEWRIPLDVAARVFPERASRIAYEGTAAVRADIARVVPTYEGIEDLRTQGDSVQWGGARLCADGRFATRDGKAHFHVPDLPVLDVPAGAFYVATRRGSQFNSMVWDDRDPLSGAARKDVFMALEDAARLGLRSESPIIVRSDVGEMRGRVKIADICPGNLQVHWPEGNVLIRMGRFDPATGEPDYNAVCTVSPAD